MFEQKVSKLNRYFEERMEESAQRGKELLFDERADEADFEKIRANVYDIFRTILSVAVRTGEGNADAVRRFFESRATQIPSGWAAAYDEAERHGDAARMQVERIKLDTIREIKESFARIWGEAE